MKSISASLLFLSFFLSLPILLSAQKSTAWGGRMQGGIGYTNYLENDILDAGRKGSFVWSTAIQGAKWWNLTPKWTVGAGSGLHLRYNRLQSRRSLSALAPKMGLELAEEESRLNLKFAEQDAVFLMVNGCAEYQLIGGDAPEFRLLMGLRLERSLLVNVNTTYYEPSDIKEFFTGGSGIGSTASEAAVNEYFRDQLLGWQAAVQIGMAVHLFSSETANRRFFLYWLYERGMVQLSQGLSAPVNGLQFGFGYRL